MYWPNSCHRPCLCEFQNRAWTTRRGGPPSGPELDADVEVDGDLLAGIAPETLEAGQFAATFDFMEADAKGFFDRYMAALGDGLAQLARPAVRADLAQVEGDRP